MYYYCSEIKKQLERCEMKVEIKYSYDQSNYNPFIAETKVDGTFFCKVSDKSFDDAKERLLKDVKEKISRPIPEIPKLEEIEL